MIRDSPSLIFRQICHESRFDITNRLECDNIIAGFLRIEREFEMEPP